MNGRIRLRREPHGPDSLVLRTIVVGILLVLLSGTAWAIEPDVSARAKLPRLDFRALELRERALNLSGFQPERLTVPGAGRGTTRFYDGYLMPKLMSQFDDMAVYRAAVPVGGPELEQFALFENVTEAARDRVNRGAYKALRDFFYEATPIDDFLNTAKANGIPTLRGITRNSSIGFSLGASHGWPKVGMRYRFGDTTLRFTVTSHGLDVQYTRSAANRTNVVFSFDDDDDGYYGLGCRFLF